MRFLNFGLSIVLLGWSVAAVCADKADPVVQVTGGQIKGSTLSGGITTFKGVPFAQPPVGDLRWRDPEAVRPWSGVREATAFGAPCIQGGDEKKIIGNEDCLTLNIWTPHLSFGSANAKPLPVMVWLYGGANVAGRTDVPLMDGASFSSRGVVFVTVNFRVGVMGFFVHPGLDAESPHHTSGNYGLLDQLAALKWVRDNIAKFGGDPNRVTLFGQSSGGIDAAYLTASPLAKGLIHRSIQESGSPIHPINTRAESEEVALEFAKTLKAPASDAIKFLRTLSGADIQKAAVTTRRPDGALEFPVIDGYVLSKYPALIFEEGNELPIPMITGNNVRETPLNVDISTMKEAIARNFGSQAPKALEFYGIANGGSGNEDPLYGKLINQMSADSKQRCGAVVEAIWRSSRGRTTYQYQFDPPAWGEAFTRHSAEIPFVFGNLVSHGSGNGVFTEADKTTSKMIQQYWVNFATNGDPNGEGLPVWPKANPKNRPYLEFTLHDGPVAREMLRHEICDLYIEGLKETIPANTAASR